MTESLLDQQLLKIRYQIEMDGVQAASLMVAITEFLVLHGDSTHPRVQKIAQALKTIEAKKMS